MGHAYVWGCAAAVRRWPVVVVLFVANLAAGLCFTAAAWSWLSVSLAKSVATRTLLTELDWNVFVDLWAHHGSSLQMLVVAGGLLALFALLLGVWLNAVAVVAVGEDGALADCLRRGLSLYPKYFRLAVLANLLNAVSVAAGFVIGRGLTRWTAESASEMTFYWAAAAGVLAGGGALLFFSTVHDHARVHCAATGAGAVRAYTWALLFVGRRERRALPLALILLTTGFLVWVVYQSIGMRITANSAGGVILSLVWGELLVLSRMLLRVWYFAAATELQNLSQ
jgi:hypothetical protein